MAHFGVVLTRKGLGVWVNMEHDRTINRFKKNFKSNEEKLLKILQNLKSYRIQLMERIELGPRRWDHLLVQRVSTDHINKETLKSMYNQLEKLNHSRLFVVGNFEPWEAIDKGKKIIDDVINSMEELKEFYDFANS